MLRGDSAASDGVDDGLPFVCAEPGGCDARVGDVEDGDGEGLEGRRGCDGQVYYLRRVSVWQRCVWGVLAYSAVGEVDDACLALLRVRLARRMVVARLQAQRRALRRLV